MRDPFDELSAAQVIENRRKGVGGLVRLIYATAIIGLALYFGVQLVTPVLFLEGPGLVTAKRHHIALPYISHIEHMNVIPGIPVQAGDEIATVYAPDISREISGLLAAKTDIALRQADLNIKIAIAQASLDPAAARLRAALETEKRMNDANAASYSLGYRAEVMREAVEAVRLNAELSSNLTESQRQLAMLATRRADIDVQIEKIQSNYNEGSVTTIESGIVSARLATVGAIILPGAPIAEILDADHLYIEWYLPNLQWRAPQRGDRVYVSSGKMIFDGVVDDVLPISGTMPGQAHPALRAPDQGRMARVKLDMPTQDLPFDSQVTVRMNYFYILDDLIKRLRA